MNDLDRVRILVKDGDDFKPMDYALWAGDVEIVKSLIDSGFDISVKSGFYNRTSLHTASLYGLLDIVKILVEAGSDIEAKDKEGKTAINLTKNQEIKEFLMEQLEIQKHSYVLK